MAVAARLGSSEAPPLPPPDPAVPALGTMLDPGRAQDILAACLVDSHYELVACRPSYLRYKPGQSCVVQYRLELRRREDDMVLERVAHARLYAGHRAERIWSRGAIQILGERVERREPGAPLRPAALVAAAGAFLQAYPVDLALPALSGLGRAELVRYKAARKALVRSGGLFAKIFADERGARVLAAGRALRAAGVPVIEPLRHSARLRLLVHRAVDGEPLASLGDASAYARGAGGAGDALARLHATPLHGLPSHDWDADLRSAARAVAIACPDLRGRADRLARILTESLSRRRAATTAHGDYSDDQILVSGEHVLVLDLDRIAQADPLLDAGSFLAESSLGGGADPARDAFLAGYGRAPWDERDLLLGEAAGLLKRAIVPFRTLEPCWPEEVERRLLLAEQRLDEAQPSVRAGVSVPTDARLPQLAALAERTAAGRVLAEVYGEPVDVLGVSVVRHRPGRRCTLRYELVRSSAPARPQLVYAKTYAGDRAERVYRALSAVAAAAPVRVPRPIDCLPRMHLVLQGTVEGSPATPRLLAGDEALAERIADAVFALHTSSAGLERNHALRDELAILDARLAGLPPALAVRAQEHRGAAAAALAPFPWRRLPVHRDFYDRQVLVDAAGRVGLLDLDDAALSEPAVDVANFLAHLRLLALEEPRSSAAVAAAAAAFGTRYSSLDPQLGGRLVHALEATTLLRLACIHLARGRRLAEELIDSSAAVLEEAT